MTLPSDPTTHILQPNAHPERMTPAQADMAALIKQALQELPPIMARLDRQTQTLFADPAQRIEALASVSANIAAQMVIHCAVNRATGQKIDRLCAIDRTLGDIRVVARRNIALIPDGTGGAA